MTKEEWMNEFSRLVQIARAENITLACIAITADGTPVMTLSSGFVDHAVTLIGILDVMKSLVMPGLLAELPFEKPKTTLRPV